MKKRFTNIAMKFLIVFITITSAQIYSATKTWNGSSSTDWNNAANWTTGVPASGDDVIIPGSLSRYPDILASQSITVRDVTINSGGTLNISGGTLSATGTTAVAGTFTQTSGSFSGGNFNISSTGAVNFIGSTFTTNENKITINGGTFNQTGGTVSTKDMELLNGGTYNQSNGEFQISHDLKVPIGTAYNGTGGTVRFTGAAGGGAEYYGTVQFYNLIVNAGADYNMDNNADAIKIAGNYTNNNSSLDNDKGTLIFNGSAPQTIYSASSPASSKTIAANVVISNLSVTLLSNIGIHSALSFNSGGHIVKNGFDIYLAGTLYNGPTPVELVSFNAKVRNNVVLLDWKTATEVNNYGFEIERAPSSTSPVQGWEKVGFVNGHGNSNSPKDYSFEDSKLSNNSYQYRLKQLDNDGTFSYSNVVSVTLNQVPGNFALYQNYPNPFNPSTKISWQSPVSGWQTLKVYDILGNEVANLVDEFREAGFYEAEFSAIGGSASGRDASQLSSGVYVYKISSGNFSDTKKMILSK